MARTYRTKKKIYKKRRTAKRAPAKRSPVLFRAQRGLRPAMHTFKRQVPHQIVHLNAAVPGAGWNTTYANQGYIAKLWKFKLSDFNFVTDFTHLFSYYKLNAVSLKIYQATGVTSETRNNSQVILTLVKGRDGNETIDPPGNLECKPARKDRLLLNNTGKPHQIYMKLNQLGMVFGATTATPPLSVTDYFLKKPSYISTTEPTTEHYGIWTYLRSVNGSSFDNIQLRIEPTLYLSCKGVE